MIHFQGYATKVFCNSVGNTKNRIFFSPCGNMMLLMMGFEKLFLWQKIEKHDSGNHSQRIGNSSYRLNFDLGKKNKIYHHS